MPSKNKRQPLRYLIVHFCRLIRREDIELIILHPLSALAFFSRLRDAVAPRESLLSYYIRAQSWQSKSNGKIYQAQMQNNKFELQGKKNYEAAIRTGRPIIIAAWHLSHYNYCQLLNGFFPGMTLLTTREGAPLPGGKIIIDDKLSMRALMAIQSHLNSTHSPLIWAFDAIFGKRLHNAIIYGSQVKLSGGFPIMVKKFNAIVLPYTNIIGADGLPVFYCHPPLFGDNEIRDLSEQEILERTINFFSYDLISKDPHQINYMELFRRYLQDR